MVFSDNPSYVPGERSPLKTGEPNPSTSHGDRNAPPPTYAAVAAAPPPVLPPAPFHHHQFIQHYVPQPPPPRDGPFKRFLKAFIVAVLILFLWGCFVDSLGLAFGHSGGKHGKRHPYSQVMDVIHGWYTDSNSTATSPCPAVSCPYQDQGAPTTPGRALPIHYPPVLPKGQVGPPDPFPPAIRDLNFK